MLVHSCFSTAQCFSYRHSTKIFLTTLQGFFSFVNSLVDSKHQSPWTDRLLEIFKLCPTNFELRSRTWQTSFPNIRTGGSTGPTPFDRCPWSVRGITSPPPLSCAGAVGARYPTATIYWPWTGSGIPVAWSVANARCSLIQSSRASLGMGTSTARMIITGKTHFNIYFEESFQCWIDIFLFSEWILWPSKGRYLYFWIIQT